MKKKLKLNKKTIAELSNTESVVGGAGTISKQICVQSVKQPCVTFPCDLTQNIKCNSMVDACPTRICISDVECNSKDGRCDDSQFICVM